MAKKELSMNERIIYFIIGIVIAIILFIGTFNFESLPISISIIGFNSSTFFIAGFFIMAGIFAGALIKTALTGKWNI